MSAVRAQAINRFFVELERRYGNLGALVDDAKVVSASRLTTDLCRKLFSHEVLAVRIPLFYSREDCERISNLLLNDTNVANWQVSRGKVLQDSQVDGVGFPYNVALGQGKSGLDRYFDEASARMQRLRNQNGLMPIDKLRLELDEVWPEGANVSKNKEGQSFLAGVGYLNSLKHWVT